MIEWKFPNAFVTIIFFFHLEVGVGGCECYSSCWKGIKNQVDSNFCNDVGLTILFLSDNIVEISPVQYFVSRRSPLMLADICRPLCLSVTVVSKMWCIYFHWLFPVSNQTIAGCLQAVMSTQRSAIFKHRHFNLLWKNCNIIVAWQLSWLRFLARGNGPKHLCDSARTKTISVWQTNSSFESYVTFSASNIYFRIVIKF